MDCLILKSLVDTLKNNTEINFEKIKLKNFNLEYNDKYKNYRYFN